MTALVGHTATLAQVPDPLPPTLLLTGPEGVGKRQAAHLLARGLARGLDFQNLGHLDREAARDLLRHHQTHPLTGPVKVSVADLTHSSHEAVNAILKLLEEPPDYSRIVLHTDTEPLLTIASRCAILRFGTLSEEEVTTVLAGLGVPDPAEAARYAHGRVSLGLDYARNTASRKATEAVLLAVAKRDEVSVEYALAKALERVQGSREDTEARRTVVCRLLAQSLSSSLTNPEHALSRIPLPIRLRALDILDGTARPALRARSAAWTLLA